MCYLGIHCVCAGLCFQHTLYNSVYAGASNAVNALKRTPLQSAQPTFTPQKVSPEMSGISSWLSEPDLISSPGHSAPSSPGFAASGFATGGSGPLMSAPCIGSPSNDRLMSSGSSAGSPESVPSSPVSLRPVISSDHHCDFDCGCCRFDQKEESEFNSSVELYGSGYL